jgi:transposase-like protein
MKVYSEEFKADAVALYLSDPARTYASVAKDLGRQPGDAAVMGTPGSGGPGR